MLSSYRASHATIIVTALTWLLTVPAFAESTAGVQLSVDQRSAGQIESFQAIVARERLTPLAHNRRLRAGRAGEWMVPTRRVAVPTMQGDHYVFNTWGESRLGIGFPQVVDVHQAEVLSQMQGSSSAGGLKVIGYRDGQVVGETEWLFELPQQPTPFKINLKGVDRIVFVTLPLAERVGFFGMDDLSYSPSGTDERTTVTFDDLAYRTKLTGSGYAGLTWEKGSGHQDEPMMIPAPLKPANARDPEIPGDTPLRVATAANPIPQPPILLTFPGLTINDAGGYFPPDSHGAIGPNHYVSVVNTAVAIFNREDGTLLDTVQLSTFQPGSGGDPRILFDTHSNRWIVVSTDFVTDLHLSISLTNDPTGDWFTFKFTASLGIDSSAFPDYPTLGVDAHGIYVGAGMFGFGSESMSMFAIEKQPLLALNPSVGAITAFRGFPFEGALQPAETFGASSGAYFVGVGVSGLTLRRIDAPLSNPTLTTLPIVNVGGINEPPDAPQLGTSLPLDTIGTRLMNCVYRNGYLYTTHSVGIDGRAAIRWYQINPHNSQVVQTGVISDPLLHYFMPSIAVNAADSILIGFSGSSSQQYAAAYFAGRRASDPPGLVSPPLLFKEGESAYTLTVFPSDPRIRYGDYSFTSVDPRDGNTFWTIQEYPIAREIWGTQVAVTSLGPVDCNENGIDDPNDITSGFSQDCNDDGVPDECQDQSDCNGNGIQDLCDLYAQTSLDCNLNGVPDECDIAAFVSSDCNNNGIPDECEPGKDCNKNNIVDFCDIALGNSQDCNGNGIPDDCELNVASTVNGAERCTESQLVCPGLIYTGSTIGFMPDGTASCRRASDSPDVWYRYEPQSSGETTVSLCGSEYDTILSIHLDCTDLLGSEIDCNDDYLPCTSVSRQSQITFVATEGLTYYIRVAGYNLNAGPYRMLLTGPDCSVTQECNDNGILDECEPDCNGNGVPDDCDIAQGTSVDANGDGRPDECEPPAEAGDLNCDGSIDASDISPFIRALLNPLAYSAQHPNCSRYLADMNQDTVIDGDDIPLFIERLLNY